MNDELKQIREVLIKCAKKAKEILEEREKKKEAARPSIIDFY